MTVVWGCWLYLDIQQEYIHDNIYYIYDMLRGLMVVWIASPLFMHQGRKFRYEHFHLAKVQYLYLVLDDTSSKCRGCHPEPLLLKLALWWLMGKCPWKWGMSVEPQTQASIVNSELKWNHPLFVLEGNCQQNEIIRKYIFKNIRGWNHS